MKSLVKFTLTQSIKAEAKRLGFMACGIAKADYLEPEARYLENWLNDDHHGQMTYMANYFDKRVDPRKLVDGAKSVVSLSYNYYTNQQQADPSAPKLAMYAYGKDYHMVVKEKLEQLMNFIQQQAGEVGGRSFVDSAPVLEKAWAKRSGVGWIGKNTNLLTKRRGSYFFLAELILDLELDYDEPTKDYCGNCTRCVDACPTQAIYEPYKLDAGKCISYFTIELKTELLPDTYKGQFENWMYGCDICQQVCPINSQSTPHNEPQFNAGEELLGMTKQEWETLSEERFRKLFKNSAVKRTKYKGLTRNINFLK